MSQNHTMANLVNKSINDRANSIEDKSRKIDNFTVVAELPGLWLEARLLVTLF